MEVPSLVFQDFPIGEARLIELAQKLQETGTGLGDESLLASGFRSVPHSHFDFAVQLVGSQWF